MVHPPMQSVENIQRDQDQRRTSLALGECPSGSVSLQYADSLLDQIRREVFDKFLSIPRGGLEIGGVLFGTITGSEIRLLAYRPLAIEYRNGPSFVLSDTDEISLTELLEASKSEPDLQGMEPVGWYHSHTRSGLSLPDEDIAVHQRFFPRPEQIALVIRPYKFDPAQAGFFVRQADGSWRGDVPQATVILPLPGKRRNELDDAPAPIPIRIPTPMESLPVAAPAEQAPAADVALPAEVSLSDTPVKIVRESPVEVFPVESLPIHFERKAPSNRFRNWAVAVVGLSIICVAGAVFLQNRSPVAPGSAPMWLRLSDAGSLLTISWDRSSPAVAQAKTVEILITDGGQETARVPLDKEPLSQGSITYVRHSGNVEVRMRVQSQADRLLEEVVRFVGPDFRPRPDPVVVVKHEEPDAEVLRIKAEMERLKKELVRVPQDGMRARSVPTKPEVTGAQAPRVYVSIPAATPSPAAASPNISDLRPPVLTSQTQLSPPAVTPAVTAVVPPPISQPPPVAKSPAGPPVQQRSAARSPGSGRAIWTGRLPKGGLLLVDGLRPSVGTLSGPLPQTAASFKVYAADLGDSGIVVYSGATQRDAVEPPSSANGWNLTTYNADKKRARSVSVLEYPGPQNGWKRLLVRSEDRALSVLVIDWTEMPPATQR